MDEKYSDLSDRIQTLLNTDLGLEYLINPFYRISKISPEQMKKYNPLFKKNHLINLSLIISIKFVKNTLLALIQLFLSFILCHQYLIFLKTQKGSECIFLSHGVASNLNTNCRDQFFALMPFYLQKEHKKVTIVYTNQYRFGYRKKLNKLRIKNDTVSVLLIPKFLSPLKSFTFFLYSLNLSIHCFLLGIRKIHSSPFESKILLLSIPYFFDRKTYSNFLLKESLTIIQKKSGFKHLMLTFEGHSYEQYVIEALSKNDEQCKFIFYQHSPLVLSHLGIKNFLNNCNVEYKVLTTGQIYSEMLSNWSVIPRYTVIGSYKGEKSLNTDISLTQSNILFTPEGSTSVTRDFIICLLALMKLSPKQKFVLRLHPNLRFNPVIYLQLKKLRKHTNFILSNQELSRDLHESKFVFYRSSAVALESLRYKTIPVFFAGKDQSYLNPLSFRDGLSYPVNNVRDAKSLIESKKITPDLDENLKYFGDFFADINYSIFREIILE